MSRSTRPQSNVRRAIPVAFVGVGFALLTGCFSIPATQQFQTNGKLRPETLVGTSSGCKIVLGKTRAEDALVALREKVSGPVYNAGEFGPPIGYDAHTFEWKLSDDGRHVGVDYQIRTGTEVWPLCFAAGPRTDWRQFVLDIDENGIVQTSRVIGPTEVAKGQDQLTTTPEKDPDRVLTAFEPAERARLHAAGLIADDDTLTQRAHFRPSAPPMLSH